MDVPGIDEFEAGLFEISDLAGGQSGLELAADRGDLSIRDADGATDPVTVGGDYCALVGVLTGQLRQDIGIEDDHASKTSARGVSLRGGRSSLGRKPLMNASTEPAERRLLGQ